MFSSPYPCVTTLGMMIFDNPSSSFSLPLTVASMNASNSTSDPFSLQFLVGIHPVFQTLIFTLINALTTALGASLIFCTVCFSKLDTSRRHDGTHDSRELNLVAKWISIIIELFVKISFKIGLFKKNQRKTASFTNDLFIPLSIGFGGGVMLAASFFSLLLPALNHFSNSSTSKAQSLFAIGASFFLGVLAILIFDAIIHKIQDLVAKKLSTTTDSQHTNSSSGDLNHLEDTMMTENANVINIERFENEDVLLEEGVRQDDNSPSREITPSPTLRHVGENPTTNCHSCMENDSMAFHEKHSLNDDTRDGARRSWIIFVAMTLHNIPEGIIVGVAFAAASDFSTSGATLATAVALSLGIAIQNITEGIAVTFPIYGNECRRISKNQEQSNTQWKHVAKSFIIGAISGITEPMGGLFGCLLVFVSATVLPYSLAFASGVMVYVVIHELIPLMFVVPSRMVAKLSTIMFIIGFIAMMSLDIGLA